MGSSLKNRHPLGVAVLVTLAVAIAGYALPEGLAGTAIGLLFLLATYLLVLREPTLGVEREYGLSLGGLLDPEPIRVGHLLRSLARALAWALGAALLTFPLFWLGYAGWYDTTREFRHNVGVLELIDQFSAQVSVVALPEEAFYRGYLQTSLDRLWRPRLKLLGAHVGPGLVVASAVFALGHLLTEPFLGRLAVFFPALLFGWLRARTGGIGAAVAFHALCNGFAWYLGRGYGLLGDS